MVVGQETREAFLMVEDRLALETEVQLDLCNISMVTSAYILDLTLKTALTLWTATTQLTTT